MTRHAAVQMVKRYARQAALPDSICCHTFRGTGITIALENGSTLEEAQRLANHADIRTIWCCVCRRLGGQSDMKPYLPTQLLLLVFVLVAGMLLTGSATAAPSVIEPTLVQSLSLPSASGSGQR
jgi:hypothetical protein